MTMPWRPDQQDVVARQMAAQAVEAVAGVPAKVAAVTPSVGTAAVPALALGASAQVVVQLSPPIPGAAYVAIPVLHSASTSLLGNLSVAGIVSKAETSVTVLVRAPLLAVASGAVLQVVAFRTG
ncbi:hypothetical protein [Paractinoplanes maris]|uniref:hypothetical protein n=1 Tax=Paractinoplanes maris TaxID=1734446 RepID=UPI002021FA18|nr:hypothetical protein [Actinoplanes maris]